MLSRPPTSCYTPAHELATRQGATGLQIMKVALVVPPFLPGYSHFSRSPAVARSGTLAYPLWLAYGAGGLERAGHDVRLIDAPAAGLDAEETLRALAARKPDLIVVDCAIPSATSDEAFAARARALARVAVGGVQVILRPESARRTVADAILVTSEYDAALPALCDALERGEAISEIAQVQSSLDGAPFVAEVMSRHLDPRHYFYACCRYPFIAILAARGCPHQCGFCLWPSTISGRAYRTRGPGDIVAEMLFVERQLPRIREIFFEDDTFNVRDDDVAARCEEMIRAGVRLPWSVNLRPEASSELLVLMRRAGCRLALVGYESGDERLLALLEKRTTLAGMMTFALAARRAGILVHGCFILGLPGENQESMRRTVEAAIRLDPDTAQFYPYMPHPGATDETGRSGQLTAEGRHAYGGTEFARGTVESACDAARRRFYLRPRFLVRKSLQSIASPAEWVRNAMAFRHFRSSLLRSDKEQRSP